MNKVLSNALVLPLAALVSQAQVIAPVGGEFQVNTYLTGDQDDPAVAVALNGEFVVVWHSYGTDGGDQDGSIQGQRYDRDGTPVAVQFQVNSYTTGNQLNPALAMASDGRGLVLWNGIKGQWYGSDGTPSGTEFELHPGGAQPALDMDRDGFVVVWEDFDSDFAGDVSGRRFASDGTPMGAAFAVNTYTTGYQPRPDVALAPSGAFLVTWFSQGSMGSDTSGFSIQARRYDSAGDPVGDQFQVNTATNGYRQR